MMISMITTSSTTAITSSITNGRTRSRQRGFTLVEIMVVIAIVAVLSGIMIGVSAKPYNANPRAVSDQLVATLSLAKLRAVSTRRWHRVQVTGPAATVPSSVMLWQWSDVGMALPNGTCSLGPPAQRCWQLVEQTTLPNSIVVHDVSTTVQIAAGAAVTQDLAIDHNIDFKPDGSSTGGTVFLADQQGTQPWRVLIYRATGSSYARKTW